MTAKCSDPLALVLASGTATLYAFGLADPDWAVGVIWAVTTALAMFLYALSFRRVALALWALWAFEGWRWKLHGVWAALRHGVIEWQGYEFR